jgi:hypothetical protein
LEIEEKGKEIQYIAQTSAILHYLGKRGGLYPPDSLEALQVEYMLETVSEALKPLEMSESGGVLSDNPWTEEELLRVRDRIANDSVCGLPHVSTTLEVFIFWQVATGIVCAYEVEFNLFHSLFSTLPFLKMR